MISFLVRAYLLITSLTLTYNTASSLSFAGGTLTFRAFSLLNCFTIIIIIIICNVPLLHISSFQQSRVPTFFRYEYSPGFLRAPRASAVAKKNRALEASSLNTAVVMEFGNEGQSVYFRFQGTYLRDSGDNLVHCTGPQKQWVQDNWTTLRSSHSKPDARIYHGATTDGHTTAIMIRNHGRIVNGDAFEKYFVNLLLTQAVTAHAPPVSGDDAEIDAVTEQLVDLFDSYLRYDGGKGDQWKVSGREYFTQRVRHFTSRKAKLEMCLPAFPCKSSNTDKVTGPDPDRGEQLALERLHGFVSEIEKFYTPGAKLWVISDGHVFSDCIGVDDGEVDRYTAMLREMNREVGARFGDPDRVGFKSLVDLFQLASRDDDLSTLATRLSLPPIEHHLDTKLSEEAELCRRILVAGSGPRKEAIRAKIDSKDATITRLYRGFSKFMLEDLENHPLTKKMSRSKQKKLSAKVAFEMIVRNHAYSNLVEMLFPNYVRLSIHAHNNAGPKFGIQLVDPAKVRAVTSLSADGELMTSTDLLHVPTPWHNCVVELQGSEIMLMTKAKLARTALGKGSFTGSLTKTDSGRAYFKLTKRPKRPIVVTMSEKIGPIFGKVSTPIRSSPQLIRRATLSMSEVIKTSSPRVPRSQGPQGPVTAPPRLGKRMFTFSEKTVEASNNGAQQHVGSNIVATPKSGGEKRRYTFFGSPSAAEKTNETVVVTVVPVVNPPVPVRRIETGLGKLWGVTGLTQAQ
ncbi:Pyoverdine/dityrosine biosynthesis protein-domain-containing protein [Triangularia verruculosa]|uniref:Pyoverdine/dityrosine biosynthesis protein-domain-containing protein n=1 Tax=Triangularia verruculosa TaxID=2587418 RepID=A0AAN6X9K2_9PEZI|nr:Pyoverdine/dityrosine biosynthesis protein-domain-containing protein [Triangularia verruculosa]